MAAVFVILAVLTAQAAPTISMIHTKTEVAEPTFRFSTCHYKGIYKPDYRVKIVVSGVICPLTIKYDPVTGTWTK